MLVDIMFHMQDYSETSDNLRTIQEKDNLPTKDWVGLASFP